MVAWLVLLGVLLVRKESIFAAEVKEADTAADVLRRFCAWIPARMVSRPGLYSLLSLLIVGGLGLIYANLEPRYRLADQVLLRATVSMPSSMVPIRSTS